MGEVWASGHPGMPAGPASTAYSCTQVCDPARPPPPTSPFFCVPCLQVPLLQALDRLAPVLAGVDVGPCRGGPAEACPAAVAAAPGGEHGRHGPLVAVRSVLVGVQQRGRQGPARAACRCACAPTCLVQRVAGVGEGGRVGLQPGAVFPRVARHQHMVHCGRGGGIQQWAGHVGS